MNLTELLKSKAAQLPSNAHLHEVSPGRFIDPPRVTIPDRTCMKLGIQPSTDEAKLNKTETAYLAWLRTLGDDWIGVMAITLKLGHDLRFTPDFWAINQDGLRAIDVKGFQREDALIKIKVAARLFPFIRFLIAKRNGAVWDHKEIKP